MYNSLRFALVGLLVLTPIAASAATTAELQAQAQALLAQVRALQAQYSGNAGTATAGACPNLTRSLSRGISGNDVLRLQTFLPRDPLLYPEAVLTGYFGPRTAAAIAVQCAGGSVGLPEVTVGGFISVSPIQGAAPLTVNVTATVNTPNSCEAATYTLD